MRVITDVVQGLCKNMQFEVIIGYRTGTKGRPCVRAVMSVSKKALVLNGFSFTPDDVVEIRIQRGMFASAVLVIDHVLFEKYPNDVIITPIDESCERLLEWIRIAGFCPNAQPMIPWLPPETPSPFL